MKNKLFKNILLTTTGIISIVAIPFTLTSCNLVKDTNSEVIVPGDNDNEPNIPKNKPNDQTPNNPNDDENNHERNKTNEDITNWHKNKIIEFQKFILSKKQ